MMDTKNKFKIDLRGTAEMLAMHRPFTTTKRFRHVISLEGTSRTIQINNIALSLIVSLKREVDLFLITYIILD